MAKHGKPVISLQGALTLEALYRKQLDLPSLSGNLRHSALCSHGSSVLARLVPCHPKPPSPPPPSTHRSPAAATLDNLLHRHSSTPHPPPCVKSSASTLARPVSWEDKRPLWLRPRSGCHEPSGLPQTRAALAAIRAPTERFLTL